MKHMYLVGLTLCSFLGFSQLAIGMQDGAQGALANYTFQVVVPQPGQGWVFAKQNITLDTFVPGNNLNELIATANDGSTIAIPVGQIPDLLTAYKFNNDTEEEKEMYVEVTNPINQALETFSINMQKQAADGMTGLVMSIAQQAEQAKQAEELRIQQEGQQKRLKQERKDKKAQQKAQEETDKKAAAAQIEQARLAQEAAALLIKEAQERKDAITAAVDSIRNGKATVETTYVGKDITLTFADTSSLSLQQVTLLYDGSNVDSKLFAVLFRDGKIQSINSLSKDQKEMILNSFKKDTERQVPELTLENNKGVKDTVQIAGLADINEPQEPWYKQPKVWIGTTVSAVLIGIIAYAYSHGVLPSDLIAAFRELLFKSSSAQK